MPAALHTLRVADDDVRFEACIGGYVIWAGLHHVGNLATSHFQGLMRNGAGVLEPVEKADWSIHWCSPYVNVDLMRTVLKRVPEVAIPEPGS